MGQLLFHTVPRHEKDLVDFQKIYDQISVVICPDRKLRHVPQKDRTCRFCKRQYSLPEVRFSKEAHVLPEFLGNKYLTSDDECDSCNEKFGRYESDFKNYLGIIPTLTKTAGKSNKIPMFRARKDEIVAGKTKRLPIEGNFIEVFKKGVSSGALQFDFEKGAGTGCYKKNPYVPFFAYKALLKIGLSCLPMEDFTEYQNAVNILQSECIIPKELATIHLTTFPLDGITVPKPFIHIFSRSNPLIIAPKHLIVLYYKNLMFQFFLPYNEYDLHVYDQDAIAQYCPPLFLGPVDDIIVFNTELVDLSSHLSRVDEIQEIKFNIGFDKDKPFYLFNPETGEHTPYGNKFPKDIVGFVIVPGGTVLHRTVE